jgi:wyosine [tRNA(Phe)-imidazoG37] synthetase (radical SAM superfamily)
MKNAGDEYRIDSHKLIFHPERVAGWLKGELIFPIYVEMSPSGACNHRCVFCAFDFLGYKTRFHDADIIVGRLGEMARNGVKSVMFCGEGEPLLNPRIAEIAEGAKSAGIDVAFTTNASMLTESLAERLLPASSWIKTSCNGGGPDTYAMIHRTGKDEFERVIGNLKKAARLRAKNGWDCALGLQILLLPEVAPEITDLARMCRDIGLDYIVVKPYSQSLKSSNRAYEKISYGEYGYLAQELAGLNTDSFKTFFRSGAMRKWDEKTRPYDRCLALPFWAYIDSAANVWGCFNHIGDDRFFYGSLYEKPFAEIWLGDERRAKLKWAENHLDVSSCRVGCRMDEINRYLWELKHPGKHVNFI